MSNNRGEEEEEEPFLKAARATEDLYNVRDTYFPPNPDDRASKLQHHSDVALSLLDSIPPEQRKSPMQRATFEYLRGKILDVFPDYRKEAEDHLSKAVKLNPSLADAWLCLGNCIWKKGDLSAAKNCLSLALNKGPDKRILCELSMLKRKMSQGAENQAELVEESIQHAKEAITLDVKDGNSWYNLGNACLTSFFVTGAWDHSKLLHSLKAYQNAEKDERMKSNPDLYFNSATVNKYLENYQRALSGFEAAALKDPGLNAAEEVQKIVNLLDKVDNLLRGPVRAKRVASLASSLAAVNLNSSYKKVTIDLLSEGLNRALAVEGKVLFFVRSESVSPQYYLLCDSNQNCFVLTVYGVRNDATHAVVVPFNSKMEEEFVEAFSGSYSMKGGEGPYSYAQNSTAQRAGLEATKSIIQQAIVNKFDPNTLSASSEHPFCIADLGCSTGPNTFIAVEYIVEAIELQYQSHGLALPEFLVFFNDQQSNDFNTLFKALPSDRDYFAVGVPGSFYGRLFPRSTLCFVNSFASLNWISKVPREITDTTCAAWNKGRIYYTNAPKEVVDAYASQYRKDMEIFLHARAQELVGNGLMALQIPAAADDAIFDSDTYPGKDLELLGTCLMDMAKEGKVNEEKVDCFNLPIFFSPLKDLKKILESNEYFTIEQMETVEGNKKFFIPVNVENYVNHHRAALEGLIQNHFGGGGVVDELFDRFAKKVKEFPDVMDIEKLKAVALFVLLKRKLYD